MNEELNVKGNRAAECPDLFSKEIGFPSEIDVGLNVLLPGGATAIRGSRWPISAEHVPNVGGRDDVTELLEFSGDALVAPGCIFLRQPDDERLGIWILTWTPCFLRCGVEAPFRFFHATVPGQQGFRRGDGGDFVETVSDLETEADEDPAVGIGQRHACAELAPKNFVLMAEIIVLLREVPLEKSLNLGDQRIGTVQ